MAVPLRGIQSASSDGTLQEFAGATVASGDVDDAVTRSDVKRINYIIEEKTEARRR